MSTPPCLHPEAAALLARFQQLGARALHELGVEGARQAVRGSVVLQGPVQPIASVTEIVVPGAGNGVAGARADGVPLRVYHPKPGTPLPLAVYLHGGGWVTGGLDEADGPCRALVLAWDCVVASVGYRLSPETPYPGPVDDVAAALAWLGANPDRVGADDHPPLVVGESAGGTLALTALLREGGQGTPLARSGLVLFYPPLRHRYLSGLPHDDSRTTLSSADMEWFWSLYLPDGPTAADPASVPLGARGLGDLPRTVLVTAEADILRNEGHLFADRLREAGVDVTLIDVPGMVHGFLGMLGALPSVRTVLDDLRTFLRPVNTSVDRRVGEPYSSSGDHGTDVP